MQIFILLLIVFIFASVSAFILFKFPAKKNLLVRILTLSLFAVYLFRLFSFDTINQVFNLFLVDIDTPINAYETWLFPPFKTFFIILLRSFSVILVAWILYAFYPLKE